MLACPFCVPAKRLVFWREKDGRLEARDHPEFANAIIYLGKNSKRFTEAFQNIGAVVIPRIANPRANTTPIISGLTAPPTEGCERDEKAAAQERFGIHCAVDADPSVDSPAKRKQHTAEDETCRIATAAKEQLVKKGT